MDQNNQVPPSSSQTPAASNTDDTTYASSQPVQDMPVPQPSEDLASSPIQPLPSSDAFSIPSPLSPVAEAPIEIPSVEQVDTSSEAVEESTEDAPTNYIENMGGSLVDLLEQVNTSPDLVATLAKEMHLEHDATQTILETFLDKVHNGTITKEELALALTAPILEEPELE